MNIGEVKNVQGQLFGSIATITIDLPRIGFRPVESDNGNAPVYEIVALNAGRRWVRIGALWEATAKGTGEVFLQGNLDDPSLPEKLYVACFGTAEEGYRIAWNRPVRNADMGGQRSERRTRSNAASFGESTAGADGPIVPVDAFDDAVPF